MICRLRVIILAICCWLIAEIAVAKDGTLPIEVPMRTKPVDFVTEIVPILTVNCLACHNEKKASGSLVLESAETMAKGGDDGPAIIPGKGAESLLLKRAAHQQKSFMPPADNTVGAKNLTPGQLGLIKLWIDQGAIGNTPAGRSVRLQPLPSSYQPTFATAVTPDGQFAVCSRGNQLFVYHLPSAKLVTTLTDPAARDPRFTSESAVAHCDLVRSLAFDSKGDTLASGSFREVKLWRRPRVTRIAEWDQEAPVQSASVSADGKWAATGDESGRIRVMEIRTGTIIQSFAGHQAAVTGIAFSAEGTTLYTTSLDKSLRAWNVTDGTSVGKVVKTSSPIHALTLIKDGKWLVTGEEDDFARVWEVKMLRELTDGAVKPLVEIKAHDKTVTALAALPGDATAFLSGGADGFVRRWNAETGKQLAELQNEGPVVALAVRPDGLRIASAGPTTVKLWYGSDTKAVAQWQGDPRLAAKVGSINATIVLSKSAIALAKQDIKGGEGFAQEVMKRTEDVKKAEEDLKKAQKAREEKNAAVTKAKMDNKNLPAAEKAAAEAEITEKVAQGAAELAKAAAERSAKKLAEAQKALADREELLKQQETARDRAAQAVKDAQQPLRTLAFSADNARLAVGCADGSLHFYNAELGTPTESLADHRDAIRALAFTSDGTLISGSADRRVLVWNASSRWRLERVLGGLNQPEVLVDRVLALDFSHDGKWLATGSGVPSRSGELKIWNAADLRLVREFKNVHSDTIFAVRFSPDGRHLATTSADRLVKVFDVQSGETIRECAGHTAHVLGVGWKSDGKMLVSCGSDNVLKLWDFETGLFVRTLKGGVYGNGTYKRDVTSVSFIGDSEEILAASGDGTVRLHRTNSENDIMTLTGSKVYQFSVAVTPDGQTMIAGGGDGVLRIWTGHEQRPKHTIAP